MSFIETKHLLKSFGKIKAVDNVSIEISKGEIFGLLGPNGAGKSTMIGMLSTFLKPDDGEIIIDGLNFKKEKSKIRATMGLVPQEIALYPNLTAKENLNFWGRMYGIGGSLLSERVNEALELAGLVDRAKEKIDTYSGGMKRRINIAAALLHRPQIVIMDEPTVGIDPQSRTHILDTVLKLNNEGMTVIYTSHYMEEVEFLCSKIAIMDYGKIIACGTKDELKRLVGENEIITIEVYNVDEVLLKKIEELEYVNKITYQDSKITVVTANAVSILSNIVSLLEGSGYEASSLDIKRASLEDVFLHLTGRGLRDI